MQESHETQVQSLNQEDLLEKETAAHSSILAWEIPWTEEPAGLQPTASQGIEHNSATEHMRSTSPGHLYQVMSDWLGPGLEPVTITTAQSFVCLEPAPCRTGPSSTLASSLVLWWVTFWGPSLLLSVSGVPWLELLGTINLWHSHPSILRTCHTLASHQGVLLSCKL